jgi:uroporphyrinogen decarboxylase
MAIIAFQPDYRNIIAAARRCQPVRLPQFEHVIVDEAIEMMSGCSLPPVDGSLSDLSEYFRLYNKFYKDHGYDTVSFECCLVDVLPGGGALARHVEPAIRCRDDFERYPFDRIPQMYAERFTRQFEAMGRTLPQGMKVVGGVGNGVFECVQDLTGFMNLCVIRYDDPDLYRDLFNKMGAILYAIWKWFLPRYGELVAVCRFGDDLGYKSQTLISHDDIRQLVFPQYRRIITLIHRYGKPFLLHSCGNLGELYNELPRLGVDAKHSNEDVILPFPELMNAYGEHLSLFGGVDTDVICGNDLNRVRDYTNELLRKVGHHPGFAIGSGNSIPRYINLEAYRTMLECIRRYRGE